MFFKLSVDVENFCKTSQSIGGKLFTVVEFVERVTAS